MLMASASCTVCQQPPVSKLKYTSSAGAAEPCTAMMMMPPWSPTCPSEQRQECSAAGVLEVASQYVSHSSPASPCTAMMMMMSP